MVTVAKYTRVIDHLICDQKITSCKYILSYNKNEYIIKIKIVNMLALQKRGIINDII